MTGPCRVFVAGGAGVIGCALRRRLSDRPGVRLVGAPPDEPDLTDRSAVGAFFTHARPQWVFVAAGKSGGIATNIRHPATLMLDNLLVTAHVLEAARVHGVERLLYLASSCAYPKDAPQPYTPDSLMTGAIEPTSAAYATAKLAGVALVEAMRREHAAPFVVGIPADVFGPDDRFDPEDSHVVGALMRRFHEAARSGTERVAVWGSGRPRRDFIYADDLADACLVAMERYSGDLPINLTTGRDVSIAELASTIADVVGYAGRIEFDTSRPDGMMRKALDAGPIRALGFRDATPLREALELAYRGWLAGKEEPLA